MLGFYIAYFSYTLLGIHPFLSVITSCVVLGGLGYFIQLGLINRVVTSSVLVTLILTFGLELMMNNAMLVSFSADYKKVLLAHPLGIAHLGNVFIPLDRAASTVIAFLLIFSLWLVWRLTSIGRAIVAVRFDRQAALLMGIDVNKTYATTFALGAALAGAAGSLLSVSFPIAPLSGPLFLSKAFVICVLGGVGSIPGAAIGGLAFGLLESFGAVLFGSEYALTLAFVVLIILLLVRPIACWASRASDDKTATLPARHFRCDPVRDAVVRQQLRAAACDHRADVCRADHGVERGRRLCGLSHVRHGGLLGLGAYSGAVAQSSGYPVALAWLVAIVIGSAFAVVLGFILLRLRGHAFAIATLVIAEVLSELTNGWTA